MTRSVPFLVLALLSTSAHAQRATGRATESDTTDWEAPGTSLLQSFYFRFENGDHHLKQVGVFANVPYEDELTVVFADQDRNDEFVYATRHVPIVDEGIFVSTAFDFFCEGTCRQRIDRPDNAGDYVFVIQGFQLLYRGLYDHHVDQFQITESEGVLTVSFNDKNNDDEFMWIVQYAYVPLRLLRNLGEVSGVAGNADERRTALGTGPMLIRGFDLDFRHNDRHIEVFGIQAQDGTISIAYGDESRNDDYRYLVQYAFVRPNLRATFPFSRLLQP